jgi:hypothetical protein
MLRAYYQTEDLAQHLHDLITGQIVHRRDDEVLERILHVHRKDDSGVASVGQCGFSGANPKTHLTCGAPAGGHRKRNFAHKAFLLVASDAHFGSSIIRSHAQEVE